MPVPLQASLPTLHKFSCVQLWLGDEAYLVCFFHYFLYHSFNTAFPVLPRRNYSCVGLERNFRQDAISITALLLLLYNCFVNVNALFHTLMGGLIPTRYSVSAEQLSHIPAFWEMTYVEGSCHGAFLWEEEQPCLSLGVLPRQFWSWGTYFL